jgi:hypothetical protein
MRIPDPGPAERRIAGNAGKFTGVGRASAADQHEAGVASSDRMGPSHAHIPLSTTSTMCPAITLSLSRAASIPLPSCCCDGHRGGCAACAVKCKGVGVVQQAREAVAEVVVLLAALPCTQCAARRRSHSSVQLLTCTMRSWHHAIRC